MTADRSPDREGWSTGMVLGTTLLVIVVFGVFLGFVGTAFVDSGLTDDPQPESDDESIDGTDIEIEDAESADPADDPESNDSATEPEPNASAIDEGAIDGNESETDDNESAADDDVDDDDADEDNDDDDT